MKNSTTQDFLNSGKLIKKHKITLNLLPENGIGKEYKYQMKSRVYI
jgi:hypothetical protein